MAGNDNKRGYKNTSWLNFNGTSDFISIPSSSNLQLLRFTNALWFKTSKNYVPEPVYGGEGIMIMKGGWASNTPGEQLSYGIWISDANHIRCGFEETDGTDHLVNTIPVKYNDGKWHHAVLTYDQVNLKLYADGVQVENHATNAIPEVNNLACNLGRNPLTFKKGYFQGKLDVVLVYNRALPSNEVVDLYNGIVTRDGLVYESFS
jgi:hypothetical protein